MTRDARAQKEHERMRAKQCAGSDGAMRNAHYGTRGAERKFHGDAADARR